MLVTTGKEADSMNFVEPIRDLKTVHDIAEYLKEQHEKYYVMFMIGIYSGLRISDILKLKVRDVRGKDAIKLREKKSTREWFLVEQLILSDIREPVNDADGNTVDPWG